MSRVTFGANLQKHLPRPTSQTSGATVGEVFRALFHDDVLLQSYVLDDQGRVRKHVNVYLNNRAITDRQRLSDAVNETDEIYVFQALSGG